MRLLADIMPYAFKLLISEGWESGHTLSKKSATTDDILERFLAALKQVWRFTKVWSHDTRTGTTTVTSNAKMGGKRAGTGSCFCLINLEFLIDDRLGNLRCRLWWYDSLAVQ